MTFYPNSHFPSVYFCSLQVQDAKSIQLLIPVFYRSFPLPTFRALMKCYENLCANPWIQGVRQHNSCPREGMGEHHVCTEGQQITFWQENRRSEPSTLSKDFSEGCRKSKAAGLMEHAPLFQQDWMRWESVRWDVPTHGHLSKWQWYSGHPGRTKHSLYRLLHSKTADGINRFKPELDKCKSITEHQRDRVKCTCSISTTTSADAGRGTSGNKTQRLHSEPPTATTWSSRVGWWTHSSFRSFLYNYCNRFQHWEFWWGSSWIAEQLKKIPRGMAGFRPIQNLLAIFLVVTSETLFSVSYTGTDGQLEKTLH